MSALAPVPKIVEAAFLGHQQTTRRISRAVSGVPLGAFVEKVTRTALQGRWDYQRACQPQHPRPRAHQPPSPASRPDGKLREETFTCPLEPFEFSTGLWGHYLTTITVHFRAGLGLDKPLKARHYIVLEKGQEDDVDEFDGEEDEGYQQVRQQTTVLVDASGAELAQGSREVSVDTYRVRDPNGRLDTVDSYLVHQLAFGEVKKPPKAKSGGKKPAAAADKPGGGDHPAVP